METRVVYEIKVYKLLLNPMHWRCEDGHIVALSTDPQKLLDWKNSFLVERYSEEWHPMWWSWNKTFAKGSVLEWYNDSGPWFRQDLINGMIAFEWISEEQVNQGNWSFPFIQ